MTNSLSLFVPVTNREAHQRTDLAQRGGDKGLEGGGPGVLVGQLRGRLARDHEDDSHGVHGPAGGRYLRHLYRADAQRPHVHLHHDEMHCICFENETQIEGSDFSLGQQAALPTQSRVGPSSTGPHVLRLLVALDFLAEAT